eukprot:3937810-Rhodomonas_salina.1
MPLNLSHAHHTALARQAPAAQQAFPLTLAGQARLLRYPTPRTTVAGTHTLVVDHLPPTRTGGRIPSRIPSECRHHAGSNALTQL